MIDAWSGPAGAPRPQEFRPQPTNGNEALLGSLRRVDERLRDATKNLFGSAGIRLKPGRMVVEQSLDIEGDLTATGSTTIGGRLDVTGNAVFSGDLAVPNGSITNEALATPVGWGYQTSSQSGFGVGPAFASFATATLVVPEGFTAAVLQVFGKVRLFNPGPADWMNIECGISGADGGGMPEPLPAGYSAHEMFGVLPLSGLTGGQAIATAVRVSAQSGLPADSLNLAYTRTVAMFFRA